MSYFDVQRRLREGWWGRVAYWESDDLAACSLTFCNAGLGVCFGSGKRLVIGGEDYCRVGCTEYSGTRQKVALKGKGG